MIPLDISDTLGLLPFFQVLVCAYVCVRIGHSGSQPRQLVFVSAEVSVEFGSQLFIDSLVTSQHHSFFMLWVRAQCLVDE